MFEDTLTSAHYMNDGVNTSPCPSWPLDCATLFAHSPITQEGIRRLIKEYFVDIPTATFSSV